MIDKVSTQYQYKPICKENQLILGTGRIAIVTGWTPKEKVAKLFPPDQYAVIGNLYSRGGIDFLVRNLLANPHVTVIMILSATKEDMNSGACDDLLNFFTHNDRTYIKDDLLEEAGEKLRQLHQEMFWHWVINIEQLKQRMELVLNHPDNIYYVPEPWANAPAIYPPQEQQSDILPGELYGQRVEGKTVADVWVKILHRIRTNGIIRASGYDDRQELINLMAIVTDEDHNNPSIPNPNWLPVDKAFLDNYYPQMIEDSPYVDGVKYTYGQRLRSWFGCDQVQQVINKICEEKDTASAVMNLWDSGSGNHDSKEWYLEWVKANRQNMLWDNPGTQRWGRVVGDSDHDHSGSPCLNHIWVRVIDDVLTMTAVFRSNDMFQAWATNAYGLRKLQAHILQEVNSRSGWNLSLGNLITISQSAHIYSFSQQSADEIIENHYKRICKEERLAFNDSVGNFLIELTSESPMGSGGQAFTNITRVTQMDKEGNSVRMYDAPSSNPLKLARKIIESNPSISPAHAAYLGIELMKASTDNNYKQDR